MIELYGILHTCGCFIQIKGKVGETEAYVQYTHPHSNLEIYVTEKDELCDECKQKGGKT